MPAYAATETINTLRKKYGEYSYKEATLNPTNPRNRTADWEADVVNRFRNYPEVKEVVGERQSSTGRSLFIAKPIQITNAACLQCHTTAAMAPPTMVKIYGEANGFGWKHNEIIGAQVVTAGVQKMAPGLKVALPGAALADANLTQLNTTQQAAR